MQYRSLTNNIFSMHVSFFPNSEAFTLSGKTANDAKEASLLFGIQAFLNSKSSGFSSVVQMLIFQYKCVNYSQ